MKKKEEAESTRERIMHAAVYLFASQGIARTTTRLFARQAGVSEGSIYRYFLSKEDMAWEIFRDYHAQVAGRLQQSAKLEVGIPAKVTAMVSTLFKEADRDWSSFSYYLGGQLKYASRADAESQHPFLVVKSIIAEAKKAGEVKCSDVDLMAAMAMGSVHQVALNKLYGRIDGNLSRFTKPVSKAVIRLICGLSEK